MRLSSKNKQQSWTTGRGAYLFWRQPISLTTALLGGKMTLSGEYTDSQTANANGFSMQYTGTKMTFENCQQMAPTMQDSGNSLVTIEGEITLDGKTEIVMDGNLNPNAPLAEVKYTMNSVQRMRADSYTVNGFVYPKIDLTFTSNNTRGWL